MKPFFLCVLFSTTIFLMLLLQFLANMSVEYILLLKSRADQYMRLSSDIHVLVCGYIFLLLHYMFCGSRRDPLLLHYIFCKVVVTKPQNDVEKWFLRSGSTSWHLGRGNSTLSSTSNLVILLQLVTYTSSYRVLLIFKMNIIK